MTRARAEELASGAYLARVAYVHRVMLVVLAVNWLLALGLATWVSPAAWSGRSPFVHSHLALALAAGPILNVFPAVMVYLRPQDRATRWAMAVAQMSWGAIFIHLTGGRIETHFHIFASLALLGFYVDGTVIVAGSLVVVIDHFVRCWFASESVFGTVHPEWWRFVEHVTWVVMEDIVLIAYARRGQYEIRASAGRAAELEHANVALAEADEAQRALQVAARLAAADRAQEQERIEARTRFLATLSHELRTPLNGVIGYLELLGVTTLGERQRELMDGSRASAQHMMELINDFLDFAKVTAGKLEIASAPFSLSDLLAQVRAVVVRLVEEKDLTLEVRVHPDTPTHLSGDALRVRQVLVNLLSNSVKFTRKGRVRLSVRPDGDDIVLFEVEDDGVGIPRDRLERIFEPFRQADARVAGTHGGTGLGLSISRQLARAMGGDLEAASTEGLGSVFSFRVRLARVAAPAAPERTLLLASTAPERPLRVLLADDNPVNRLVGRQLLEVLGHRAEVAEDGAIAVERAKAQPYDLVIMDVEMPNLDGYGATRALRAHGIGIPVLGFTAHTDAAYTDRCREAGMNAVVHKPLDREKLAKALAQVMHEPSLAAPAHEFSPTAHVSAGGRPRPLDIARRRMEAESRIERARADRELADRRAHERPHSDESGARPAEALFDLHELRARVGGDDALASEVLAAVVSDSLRIKREMDAALAAHDPGMLRRAAHTLKGCVANVAAHGLVRRCGLLEEAARAEDLAACEALMPELTDYFGRVHEGLSAASVPKAA